MREPLCENGAGYETTSCMQLFKMADSPENDYVHKVRIYWFSALKDDLNTDDSSFDRLVDKASQWLDEKGKKPYELPNIRKFRKASTRFEDLVLDLGQKGCLLGSFIELLREAELDSHADTLEDHIESASSCALTHYLCFNCLNAIIDNFYHVK